MNNNNNNNNDLIIEIKQLQEMLSNESKIYYCKDKSSISDSILNYSVCFHVLMYAVEQNNFIMMKCIFDKYKLNIKGLLRCFKDENDKSKVKILYSSICKIILQRVLINSK